MLLFEPLVPKEYPQTYTCMLDDLCHMSKYSKFQNAEAFCVTDWVKIRSFIRDIPKKIVFKLNNVIF